MSLALEQRDGLYYAPTDVYTINRSPVRSIALRVRRVVHHTPQSIRHPQIRYVPVTKSNQTESELWMLWLGSPGESQLDMLPGNAAEIPSVLSITRSGSWTLKNKPISGSRRLNVRLSA
jgi:hypothetical protein